MVDGDRALLIGLNDVAVGVLRLASGLSTFELLDEYLEMPLRPVLGQRFEESPQGRWRQSQRLPAWFSNLLPEDALRDAVAQNHDISPRSEYKLLEALSDDLPGAVTAAPVDSAQLLFGERRAIERSEPEGDGTLHVRFSLAGVQLKLSMSWERGTLTLPGTGEAGDKLVKMSAGPYRGIPENEFYMMQWAAAIGLDVANVNLVDGQAIRELPVSFGKIRDEPILVVDRFDRMDDEGRRIHMEDFNQVLGNWPEDKYRGANYEKLGVLIRTLCPGTDFEEYVRRLVFCVVIGNEDAHLKNWSLWYPDGIQAHLSPAYDLVSTIQYDDLDRGMALSIGYGRDFAGIDRTTFGRLARKIGADEGGTLGLVDETLSAMRETWPAISEQLEIPVGFRERLSSHIAGVPLARGVID